MCGQLLQILEDPEQLLESSITNNHPSSSSSSSSQVFPINSSGMSSGLTHSSPVPSHLEGSTMPPPLPQGIRPPVRFFCPVCPKGFRSKLDMERHMRTHTGEKPFKCPYCSHRSATKGNLKAHIRHIHVEAQLTF